MSEGGVMPFPWAEPGDIANAWRPLTDAQTDRAQYLIDSVARAIRREWPDTIPRIAAGTLDADDVRDVVVWSIIPILSVDTDIPVNAKAYQETSGSESRSITLESGNGTGVLDLDFPGWMVRVFEGGAYASRPRGPRSRSQAPAGGRFDTLGFLWPENGTQRSPGAER